jgi:hypothetical protein
MTKLPLLTILLENKNHVEQEAALELLRKKGVPVWGKFKISR